MPISFPKYFKTKGAFIIDWFDIFVNQTSNLAARSAIWSRYKHHNTVKFAIVVSSKGVITFISNGWGGRVSDKYITKQSTSFRNLMPGDVILADRGFNIIKSAAFYCTEIQVPALTKGKKQVAGIDVESRRRITTVKILVEWVIGLLRNKYKITEFSSIRFFKKK